MAATIEIGSATVVALRDKSHHVERSFHFPSVPEAAWEPYADLLTDEGLIPLNFGCFLVIADGQHVLIDTGWGPETGPPGRPAGPGRLLEELSDVGVSPDEIDIVAFTHLHPDHVGWNLVRDGDGWVPRFRNARYLVPQADWDHYREREQIHPLISEQGLGLDGMDALDLVASDGILSDSLRGVATPGHTPGHRSFIVESAGERLFILGDLAHTPVIANEVDWINQFDWDKPQAVVTRRTVLARLEAEGTLVGAGHFPYPSLGRLVRVGDRRTWMPVAVR